MSKNTDDLGLSPEEAIRILGKWLPGLSTPETRIRLTDEIKNQILEDVAAFDSDNPDALSEFTASLGAAVYALAAAVGDMQREALA